MTSPQDPHAADSAGNQSCACGQAHPSPEPALTYTQTPPDGGSYVVGNGAQQRFAPPTPGIPGGGPRYRKRISGRDAVLGSLVVILSIALVTSFVVGSDSSGAAEAAPTSDAIVSGSSNSASAESGTGSAATGDLRESGVFVQSNAQDGNVVVAFARKEDGTLSEVGRYETGGTGSGSFEDSAQGVVLGSATGEVAPAHLTDDAELLFVANAGSSTITVFKVSAAGLERVEEVPSGGNKPVSLTVNRGRLYVLNSGETDNRLILGPTTAIENCTTGSTPTITGFNVTDGGSLTPIVGSTRQLSGQKNSGCAQVSFTPDGASLLVTERIANPSGGGEAGNGAITMFDMADDGSLGTKRSMQPTGKGPFGFTFTRSGVLVMTEQNGGFANPGGGGVSSYTLQSDNSLSRSGSTVPNMQTDTCWVVVTDNGQLAFASSPFDGGSISSYAVGANGSIKLLKEVASAEDGVDNTKDGIPNGATDMSLSRDSKYLYQLNSFDGDIYVFSVVEDGTLSLVETHDVFDLEPFGEGGEAAPFGIAAF